MSKLDNQTTNEWFHGILNFDNMSCLEIVAWMLIALSHFNFQLKNDSLWTLPLYKKQVAISVNSKAF